MYWACPKFLVSEEVTDASLPLLYGENGSGSAHRFAPPKQLQAVLEAQVVVFRRQVPVRISGRWDALCTRRIPKVIRHRVCGCLGQIRTGSMFARRTGYSIMSKLARVAILKTASLAFRTKTMRTSFLPRQ